MGCGNEMDEKAEEALRESENGENCEPAPNLFELPVPELTPALPQPETSTPASSPSHFHAWLEYMDLVNENLEKITSELPLRLENAPPIEGFEKSGVVDNTDVKYYLSELSLNALEKIDRPIRYVDIDMGSTRGLFNPSIGTIIYRQPSVKILQEVEFSDVAERTPEDAFAHALYHETAHNIWENLPSDKKEYWENLYETTLERSCGFVSGYSEKENYDAKEDFAESFWTYKENPGALFKADPEKFEFFNKLIKEGYL
jgi:hypothetical protein